jgi:hypothetical protein
MEIPYRWNERKISRRDPIKVQIRDFNMLKIRRKYHKIIFFGGSDKDYHDN